MKSTEISKYIAQNFELNDFKYISSKCYFERKSELFSEKIYWITSNYGQIYLEWYSEKEIYLFQKMKRNLFLDLDKINIDSNGPIPGINDLHIKLKNLRNKPNASEVVSFADIDLMINEIKPFIFDETIPFFNSLNTLNDIDKFYNDDVSFAGEPWLFMKGKKTDPRNKFRGLERSDYSGRMVLGTFYAKLNNNPNYENIKKGYFETAKVLEARVRADFPEYAAGDFTEFLLSNYSKFLDYFEKFSIDELYEKYT